MKTELFVQLYAIVNFLEKQWIHIIQNALQKWKDYEYEKKITCSSCTNQDIAVKFCIDCEEPIDELCLNYHKSINSFLDHTTIPIIGLDEKFTIKHFATKLNCPDHRLLQSTSYCTNCNKYICQECAEYHLKMNHNVDMLKDVYLLFDNLHALKRSSEDKIHTHPDLAEEEHAALKMSISWIEVIFGIRNEYTDIDAVPLQTNVRDALKEEKSSPKTIILKIKELKDELESLKRKIEADEGYFHEEAFYSRFYDMCIFIVEGRTIVYNFFHPPHLNFDNCLIYWQSYHICLFFILG